MKRIALQFVDSGDWKKQKTKQKKKQKRKKKVKKKETANGLRNHLLSIMRVTMLRDVRPSFRYQVTFSEKILAFLRW